MPSEPGSAGTKSPVMRKIRVVTFQTISQEVLCDSPSDAIVLMRHNGVHRCFAGCVNTAVWKG
jgi:hypothetical protein